MKIYPVVSQKNIVPFSKKADIIVTNKMEIGEKEFSRLPHLELICVTATGVNNLDLKAAQKRGVAVCNVPGYSTPTVAEHSILFLLALGHRLLEHQTVSANGTWSDSGLTNYTRLPFQDLEGKNLGIIGYGAIGRRVARFAKLLGMEVRIAKIPGRSYPRFPRRLSLREILKRSDFVAIHTALTDTTHHLLNKKSLKWMKPTASLVNVARGAVVDEKAVADALRKGRLLGYATDVMSTEPPPKNHPLFHRSLRNKVLFSPHIAWASIESRQRVVDEVGKNIAAFLANRRRNRLV